MSIYEAHQMDPRLPLIFHSITLRMPPLPSTENWHENIELLYVTRGQGTVVGGERPLRVSAGEIAVINSNCLHAITATEEMHYYCLIVDRAFCLGNYLDPNRIRFDPKIRDPRLSALLEELAREYFTSKEGTETPYRIQAIRALVLQIMVLLCRHHSLPDETPDADSRLLSCIKQAVGYIHSESQRDLSLDETAARVGLSKFYFAREFRRITGYTFVSYLNLVRCEKAKILLAESRLSIGEISLDCGFANQSYFSRIFTRIAGLLPSEYRARYRLSGDRSKSDNL